MVEVAASWPSLTAAQVSYAALGVSIVSALMGVLGWVNSFRALKLSRAQEARKAPQLNTEFIQASWVDADDGQTYRVRVLVRNRSDSANAVSDAELATTYTVDGRSIPLKIPRDKKPKALPAQLVAGGSVQLDLHFTARAGMFDNRSPQGFQLYLVDTHGTETAIDLGYIHKGE